MWSPRVALGRGWQARIPIEDRSPEGKLVLTSVFSVFLGKNLLQVVMCTSYGVASGDIYYLGVSFSVMLKSFSDFRC